MMNKIKEIIKEFTRQAWMIIGSIGITIILIVGGVWLYSSQQKNNEVVPDIELKDLFDETNDEGASSESVILSKEEIIKGHYLNDIQNATTYVRNTQEVDIAVIKSDEQSSDMCGSITFVKKRVAMPAVLTQALQSLFSNTVSTDFLPGNIIATQHPNLIFEKVVIENAVAKVYVTGTFNESSEVVCGSNKVFDQIVSTAVQFDSVKEVEIYQNNVKVY